MQRGVLFVVAAVLAAVAVPPASAGQTVVVPLGPSQTGCPRAQGTVDPGQQCAGVHYLGSLSAACEGTVEYSFSGAALATVKVWGWAEEGGAGVTWTWVGCTPYRGLTPDRRLEATSTVQDPSQAEGSWEYTVPASDAPDRLCAEAASSVSGGAVAFAC